MRIARHAGLTEEEAYSQPLEYLYLLAADAEAENKAIHEAAPSSPSSSGTGAGAGQQRTIRYVQRPKPRR